MIAVTHFSDPGCPWAYSAAPFMSVLAWRYGDQLAWRHAMIGLTEEAAQYEVVGQVEHIVDDEPAPSREPEPEPDPAPDDEPVRYFWVDENGVEHEVSEDELEEFELYDEDES